MYKNNYLSEAINCINCVYRDLFGLCVGLGRAVDLSIVVARLDIGLIVDIRSVFLSGSGPVLQGVKSSF